MGPCSSPPGTVYGEDMGTCGFSVLQPWEFGAVPKQSNEGLKSAMITVYRDPLLLRFRRLAVMLCLVLFVDGKSLQPASEENQAAGDPEIGFRGSINTYQWWFPES